MFKIKNPINLPNKEIIVFASRGGSLFQFACFSNYRTGVFKDDRYMAKGLRLILKKTRII